MAADHIEAQPSPQVSIIIPTFNNLDFTRQCLEAIRETAGSVPYEIIAVDNASTDGTPGYLLNEQNAGRLRAIFNEANLGFGKACNQGAHAAHGKYLLFLNNDTEVQSGWLEPLVKLLDQDSSVAAAGSKLLYPDKTIQHAGILITENRGLNDPLLAYNAYVDEPENFPEANQLIVYQALTAACLMIRKSSFEEVGGFDEGYWNGYEDIDLCFKLQQEGWKLVYQPKSVVIHHESKSRTEQSRTERFSKVRENSLRLHSKWLGRIKPDFIIEKDGSIIRTDAGKIKPYSVSKISGVPVKEPQPETREKLTSIIILTYNQLEHTHLCLDSIRKHTPEPHEIIMVDNGSTDGTLTHLRKLLKPRPNMRVIANASNRGFAAGNNQGISIAKGSYILLLNNDTIVTEGWLGRMQDIIRKFPETGIVGPMSNYVSGPQLVPEADYKKREKIDAFAERWTKQHTGQSFPIYRVVGFCLLTKREVIDRIGGLDERFGSGNFEDDDFCLRAALSGFKARVAQDVFIHHTGSQTFKSAGIDLHKSLLRNWELFKAKWGIPLHTPYGKGYQLPSRLSSHSSLSLPLPNVSADHHPDAENRWWQDRSFKSGKKQKPKDVNDIYEAMKSAMAHHQAGNLSQAENIYRKILKTHPNNVDALHYLGVVYYQLGNYDLAIKYNKKALNFNPNIPKAYYYLGNAFNAQGQPDEAISCYRKALQIDPTFIHAYFHLGKTFGAKGQLDDAITCYQKALKLNPNFVDAYNNLGNAFRSKGQIDDAITCYQRALKLNPKLVEAYYNLGNVLRSKGQLNEAITCYQNALQIDPKFVYAYNNLGNVLRDKGQLNEAITCYQNALQLKQDIPEVYINMGVAFMDQDSINEAISCFQKALQLKTDLAEACCNLVHQFQRTCAWQELKAMTAKLDSLTKKALDTGTKPAESPFHSVTRHADLSINFAIAKSWSRSIARDMSNLKIHFSFDDRKTGKTKLVIGYLSNDFLNHATAHLMLSLFGLHNRDEFKIFCYSYGKDDGSSYRARIQNDCDKFVDISSLSYTDAAKRIHEDQVDILVDLKGYTKGNRLAICALRPAPIQVSYLGFPGTTGADFIDYIITDKIMTPEEHSLYYSEKFVYLPHCYQVNDHTQPISNKGWKKEDLELPESSFVFCSFNHPYKIDPVMFDTWMKILRQVPESVLWLLLGNKTAEENLRREAETRGVKSERLVFAERLPKDEHLGRLRFADLTLDTWIVNGHTTTSDSLWAGVPVITLQGSHFASRVSSSALSAIGLPELITHSLEEYEALAVQLAHNPAELQELRQRLARNRLVAPLFDTPRFLRNLESAYKEMWNIFLAGEAPGQIEVLENGMDYA